MYLIRKSCEMDHTLIPTQFKSRLCSLHISAPAGRWMQNFFSSMTEFRFYELADDSCLFLKEKDENPEAVNLSL